MSDFKQHKLAQLSFAEVRDDYLNLWPAVDSSDYAAAAKIGHQRAEEVMQYIVAHNAPMILGHVAAAMSAVEHGPAETAFFQRVAANIVVPADMAAREPAGLKLVTA